MNVATLIALTAERMFSEAPERLGVRCSPVTLAPEELLAAVRATRATLGKAAFIVGSAPGTTPDDVDDRAFLAPDHRAAERATAWRNRVDVGAGEHLIYLSVEEHPKASGLKDCLIPLRETDLFDTFFAWADSAKSGLPPGLADALRASGLAAHAPLSALCALTEAAIKRSKKKAGAAWDDLGLSLPIVGLAADSKLGKADAAERLAANAALVRAVSTGEARRRSEAGPLAAIEGRLAVALAGSDVADRAVALASVDLGTLKTPSFAKKKAEPRRARVEVEPAKVTPPKKAKRDKPSRVEPPTSATAEPKLGIADTSASPGAERIDAAAAALGAQPEASGVADGSSAMRPVRLHGPTLSSGTVNLLETLLRADGCVQASTRGDPRSLLRAPSKNAVLSDAPLPNLQANLPDLLRGWRAARRALIDLAVARGGAHRPSDLLTRGMGALMLDEQFAEGRRRLATAADALFAAAENFDEATMVEALTLDTCAVLTGGSVSLRLIGPLHMLSLGQTVAGANAGQIARALPDAARRLVTRAAIVAPACPATFPDAVGELTLSTSQNALVVYERVPELVPASAIHAAARTVALRFIALAPHALLGLRVALIGDGDLAPALDGLADALEQEPLLRRVEALCAIPPEISDRASAARAIQSGRLALCPFDDAEPSAAHVALVVVRHGDALDEEPAIHAASFAPVDVGARTTFELRPRGLRVRTSIAGVRELEALERTSARAKGRIPQRAFTSEVVARSLRFEVERAARAAATTWTAVVGPEVGRRPPLNLHLLAHEEIAPGITCAVVARDLKPATRALQAGLRSLDLREERPRTLQMLAVRLAELGRSAIVALERPPEHLVAVGLLAAELRKALGEGAVVAPMVGPAFEALTGLRESDQPGATFLGVAPTPTGLRATVAFSALDPGLDLDATKSHFAGSSVRALVGIVEAVHLASSDAGPGGAAAREILSWALWSAIVKDEAVAPSLRSRLSSWSEPLPIDTDVLMLVRQEVVGKERSGKVGRAKATVKILGIDQINRLLLAR